MLIGFPFSPGCEGSRERAYGWSHWLICWVFSPSILWPEIKGGWVSKLVNPAWAGGSHRPTEHSDKKVFRTLRHSLLRNQILNMISEDFYLSPSGEIVGLMSPRAVLSGDLWSCHSPYWNFFLSVFLLFPFLGLIFRGKSLLDPPGEIQAHPFPCKINLSNFYCLLNPSWSQMGRESEVSFNSLKPFFSC